ncbi:MAG: hypothetical protein ACLSUW_00435 [Akkermansia sp.]
MTLGLWCLTGVASRNPFLTQKITTPALHELQFYLALVLSSGPRRPRRLWFHRLTIVYLYWKNRNNKPQPKSRFRSFPWSRSASMFNEKFVVDRLLNPSPLGLPQDKLEIRFWTIPRTIRRNSATGRWR